MISILAHRVVAYTRSRFVTFYLPILALMALLLVVLIRTAWVSDDAYITFRTVDNFVHGYGLTWNVGERVQTYTHPLWMFLITGLYVFTHEPFYSSIGLSILLTLLAAGLIALRLARSGIGAVAALSVLVLSRSFVDYSTSGLENPLTHVCLIGFVVIYLRSEHSRRNLLWLAILAGLLMLNRMDSILFVLPGLAYVIWRRHNWRDVLISGIGFVPMILWEVFSVFYYGVPLPNTAYAKLNTGISQEVLFRQGLTYYLNSLRFDPITLSITALALVCAVWMGVRRRTWLYLPLAGGIVLYNLYILRIGGDFMSGRFFSSGLVVAVALLADSKVFRQPDLVIALLGLPLIVGLGLASPSPDLFSGIDYKKDQWYASASLYDDSIADERGYYFWCSNLLDSFGKEIYPGCPWSIQGYQLRMSGETFYKTSLIGSLGYMAGPSVHILDPLALGDPLLARMPLPILYDRAYRPGHYTRPIPPGYSQTIQTHENHIDNPDLAEYYDHLSLVVSGDLFDPQRAEAIWKLNTGQYDYLIITREALAQVLEAASNITLDSMQIPDSIQPGASNPITFQWSVSEQLPFSFVPHLILTDSYSNVIEDIESSVRLKEKMTTSDTYALNIPGDIPAIYFLTVSASAPELSENYEITLADLGRIKVSPPAVEIPTTLQRIDANIGGEIKLLGYTFEQEGKSVQMEDIQPVPLTVSLYWQAIKQPSQDYTIFVHGMDTSGRLVTQFDGPAYGGRYPTDAWEAGEIVTTTSVLEIPPNAGLLSFYVGMYVWPAVERLSVVQDGVEKPDRRIKLTEP